MRLLVAAIITTAVAVLALVAFTLGAPLLAGPSPSEPGPLSLSADLASASNSPVLGHGTQTASSVPSSSTSSPSPSSTASSPSPSASPLPEVLVCVLDSGVLATHLDLAGFLERGLDLVGNDGDPEDTLGHGTQVASRIVQGFQDAGGQEHASLRILPIKVLQADGRFTWTDVASGLFACRAAGADFVNLSFGHTEGSPDVEAAVSELADAGITILAAAGNSGRCDDCVSFPAKYDGVLAVGCIDDAGLACPKSSAGPQLDLVAPGMKVLAAGISSESAQVSATGTSMAAPYAAGMMAALSAAGTDADSAIQDAADLGPQGWDPLYGHGRVTV